jgi:hypothetical protein
MGRNVYHAGRSYRRKGPMEPADWINEQVRGEIETLQRTHGFEEDEAVAFWLL